MSAAAYLPMRPDDGLANIGQLLELRAEDPRAKTTAKKMEFTLGARGAEVVGESLPLRPWAVYVPESPRWRGEDYVQTQAYAVGVTVYFNGDFYKCQAAAAANESPATAADKWQVIPVPACLTRPVEQMAYAEWLLGQGQTEKAMVERAAGEQELFRALDACVTVNGQHGKYNRRGS
jgi:hypothetical protein